jgi:hypothetical protein
MYDEALNPNNVTKHTEAKELGRFLGMTTKVQANNAMVKEKTAVT